jgi:hypothetical protein
MALRTRKNDGRQQWRDLARQGYGDRVVRDQNGDTWVVFEIHNPAMRPITDYTISVKQDGSDYTDVRVDY